MKSRLEVKDVMSFAYFGKSINWKLARMPYWSIYIG